MIIAGPALRKTTTSEIYIWLALTAKPDILTALIGLNPLSIETSNISEAEPKFLRLGEHIYIALIKVTPSSGTFPENTKLYYDVHINGASLNDLNLINDDPLMGVNLPGDNLPSLFIPTKHAQIAYGSCRKPHAGKGASNQFDQFQSIDEGLCTYSNDLQSRISMLCLTGDQIYADDVALPLLCGIQKLAISLFGVPEMMPRSTLSGRDLDVKAIKYGDRMTRLRNIGFSSGHGENHLITLDEYACMYLAVMGGVSITMPDYEEISSNIKLKTVKRNKVKYRHPVVSKDEYDEQKARIHKFLNVAPLARRVMANVPTYMMFDDHEVTDDWNLTRANEQKLRNNSLSSRIQSNGLITYWAFQGWGNNPDTFSEEQMDSFHLLRSPSTSIDLINVQKLLFENDYSYGVAGYPYLLALDTRTKRETTATIPRLLNDAAFDRLEESLSNIANAYANNSAEQSLLLLSPAPVLGFKAVEKLQFLASGLPNFTDNETWIGGKSAYERLLNSISKLPFRNCCVISGDVHYAFVRHLKLENSANETLDLFQLTSSSLHNTPSGVGRFFLDLLSQVEQGIFRRRNTPYLMPKETSDEIINGNTNYGQILFVNGQPIKNQFTFNSSLGEVSYKWNYDLTTLNPFN